MSLPLMPIIVGAPRSGTTMLRFILDAHSTLAIPPETGFLAIAQMLRGEGDDLREHFFRAVTSYPPASPLWPDFEIPEETFRSALASVVPFTIPDGYRTFYRLYAARFEKTRWGDKTPLYAMSVEPIRQTLPEARFIHVIRDGRDVALSVRETHFSPGRSMSVQAEYWAAFVRAARRDGLGRADYLEVRFEDLVRSTRRTVEKVCEFVDLSFETGMLSYFVRAPERLKEHKTVQRQDGVSITHEQRLALQALTMQPPNPSRVFAWKHRMDTIDQLEFERNAGDLLRELRYEV